MSTLFEQVMNLDRIDDTILDDEYVTEAVSPENIPELTLFTRKVFLPKGEPVGRGNLVCHFANSVQDTIDEINNSENYAFLGTSYRYYFYNLTYSGTMKNRRFYMRDTKEKKEISEMIKKNTPLIPVQNSTLESFNRNCYFEMSKYLQIYHAITDNAAPTVRMNIFWNYLNSILNDTVLSGYKNKIILINASKYDNAFEGKLKEKLKNPIFMIYYTLYKNPKICSSFNHEIIIFYKNKSVKIIPSHAEERTTAVTFKQLIMRMMPHKEKEIETGLNNKEIEKEETAENVKNSISEDLNINSQNEESIITEINVPSIITKNNAVETVPMEKEKDLVKNEIKDSIDKKIDAVSKTTDNPEEVISAATSAIDNDKELLNKIYSSMMNDTVPNNRSTASSARDKQIRENQGNIAVGDMTIDKLKNLQTTHMPIPEKKIGKTVKTTNENVKNIKFPNFEKTYNDKVFPKDMVNAFLSLNSKSIPLTIIKYDIKDTSDELNYKDTYTVVLEDINRQRHTINVDIPKFVDDRYMWIGGSKKMIIYQNFLYPVIKCGPDMVQIVTNYNKMFIERFGTKSITSLERLKKLVGSDKELSEFFKPGYAFKLNADYVTTVEYDELSKQFIKFETDNTTIYFNQQEAIDEATKMGIPIGEKEIFIGIKDKKPLFVDQDTQQVGNDKSISDIIIDSLPDEYRAKFESIKAPKRLMYSAATTMEQKVSLGLLMGFWEGISSVLKALGITYRLERNIPKQIKSNESYLQFKDCVMVYTENVAQSLIMNGFRIIETKQYTIAEMNTKEPYMDYLIKVYGKRSISNALMNTYEFTIDPITYEILEDMKLPTSLVPLVIYANSLLADSQYTPDYNQHLCRIRTSEILPAILYDCIAKQYIIYKNSNGKKKLSLAKDCVIKKLLALNTVEESSTLNPFLELQRKTITMYRGWRGINEDRSYTQDKRVYDKSMVGIVGLTSSPDASVGVQKPLTMEPNVISARGYLNVEEDYNKLKDVNVFSTLEMLAPLAPERDDPTRVGFYQMADFKPP